MKKFCFVIVLGILINVVGCEKDSIKDNDTIQTSNLKEIIDDNKESIENIDEYEFNNAFEKGYLLRKTYISETGDNSTIYNKDKLDTFNKNISNKIEDELTIVEYFNENNKLTINKLSKINYDGDKIVAKYYDVITNRNKFELTDVLTYKLLDVKESNGMLKYSLIDDSGNEMKLISFSINEVLN